MLFFMFKKKTFTNCFSYLIFNKSRFDIKRKMSICILLTFHTGKQLCFSDQLAFHLSLKNIFGEMLQSYFLVFTIVVVWQVDYTSSILYCIGTSVGFGNMWTENLSGHCSHFQFFSIMTPQPNPPPLTRPFLLTHWHKKI